MLIDPGAVKIVLDSYGVDIKGILHVGAHECEEKSVYNTRWGVTDDKIIWVDANEDLVKKNLANGIPHCYQAVLDEVERDMEFKITNNGQSSSILEFGSHKDSYPDIVVVETRKVRTQTLQQFVDRNKLNLSQFNVWNFDIQGVEVQVLHGSKDLLRYADAIYTEINVGEVYKGCGLLSQMDSLLESYGLRRILTNMTGSNWGDALYVRVEAPPSQDPKITLGIPTYRRFKPFLEQYLPEYLSLPFVDEILICDETGEDIEQIRQQPWGSNKKLTLVKNPERYGVYKNKLTVLNAAKNDWVAIIDSDNQVLPEYFQALYTYWKEHGRNEHGIYLAGDITSYSVQNPQHKVRQLAHMSGFQVTKESWNSFYDTVPNSQYALNMMNCVLHKKALQYLPINVSSLVPEMLNQENLAYDSILITKTLVENGFTLIVVPGMKYYHIDHPGSNWRQNHGHHDSFHKSYDWKFKDTM